MSRLNRPLFAIVEKFVADRAFRFAGRPYEPGDPFDWRKASCSVRRLRQLYDMKLINPVLADWPEEDELPVTDDENLDDGPDTDDLDESDDDESDDETEDDGEDEEDEGGLIYDPDVHLIENPSRGVWVMTKNDEIVAHLLAREAKRLRKKGEPTEVDPDSIVEE